MSLSHLVQSYPITPVVSTGQINFSNKNMVIGISGASGFLGLHLIDTLLQNPDIKYIKCFIRERRKFCEKKKFFNLNFSEEKLIFYTDIKAEYFSDISHFIHTAAQLHSLKNCNQLYQDNIELTKSFLSMCKGKFHHISTLSVFASSNRLGDHSEGTIAAQEAIVLYGGYAQTKYLAEKHVEQYHNFQIIRLGLLTPRMDYPYIQKHEFLYQFIRTMRQIGVYPENYEESFVDLSPVDRVAQTIADNLQSLEKYRHIAQRHSVSVSQFISAMQLTAVSEDKWRACLSSLPKTLQILLDNTFYKTKMTELIPHYYNIDLFQSTGHNWRGQLDFPHLHNLYIKENL